MLFEVICGSVLIFSEKHHESVNLYKVTRVLCVSFFLNWFIGLSQTQRNIVSFPNDFTKLDCSRSAITPTLAVRTTEVFIGLKDYQNGQSCRLLLTSESSKEIKIRVVFIKTEARYDKVTISTFISKNNKKKLASLDGDESTNKDVVFCATQQCIVEFNSDGSTTGVGFLLGVAALNHLPPQEFVAESYIRTLNSFRSMQRRNEGSIKNYLLHTSPGRRVVVLLKSRSTSLGSTLLLYEGRDADTEGHLLQQDESKLIRSVYVSSGREVLLRHVKDSINSNFTVDYYSAKTSAIVRNCGSSGLTVSDDENITIISPGFPNTYLSSMDCVYRLKAQFPLRILKAQSLLFTTERCCDRVRLYSGLKYSGLSDSNALSEWTKTIGQAAHSVQSSCNALTIRFSSDASVQEGGFVIVVKSEDTDLDVQDCSTEEDKPSSSSSALKTVAIVAGCVVGFLVCCGVLCRRCRTRRRRRSPAADDPAATTGSVMLAPRVDLAPTLDPLIQPSAPPPVDASSRTGAPPSYDDVMENENSFPKADANTLPTYEQYRTMEPLF